MKNQVHTGLFWRHCSYGWKENREAKQFQAGCISIHRIFLLESEKRK